MCKIPEINYIDQNIHSRLPNVKCRWYKSLSSIQPAAFFCMHTDNVICQKAVCLLDKKILYGVQSH